MELVSVIIPVFNCEKWIQRCIESVLEQTYKNLEIIIINDGSTDNSLEICKKYESSKLKIYNKQNSGVSQTRNIGVEKAQGKYIFFIDADDYIEKDCIEKSYEVAKKYDADIVKCNYKQFDELGNVIKQANFEKLRQFNLMDINEKKEIYQLMIDTYKFNNVWGQLILTEKAKKVKFDNRLAMGEDFIYNYEIFDMCKKVVVIPDDYYAYYFNQNGMAFNEDIHKIKRKIEDTIYFYELILKNNHGIEEYRILQSAIKEITLHVVNISTNRQISKKNKKQYLKEILNAQIFKKMRNNVAIEKIKFENKRHQIVGNYIIKGKYRKLYLYLQYIYNPLKKIKILIVN